MREFTEQEKVRRGKIALLEERGFDPFGGRYDRTHFSKDIKDTYQGYTHEKLEEENICVKIAGRIMFIRKMGKASFFSIKDVKGPIQVYISINDVGEDTYTLFKSADIGDIVGVEGTVMLTKTGEVTIKCKKYTHIYILNILNLMCTYARNKIYSNQKDKKEELKKNDQRRII